MMIKAIVFDMDGVIVDTIPFAQKWFMDNHPGLTEEMYKEIHAGNFHEEAKKHSHLKIERTKEEAERHRAAYSENKSKSSLFNGIRDFLEELHKSGITLVLNTNSFERNVMPILKRSEIDSLFDFVATADLSKSKVEKFNSIKERYKLNKEDILFVTDALGDVKEAEIADIPTVAVTWGVHDRAYFEREKYKNLIKIVNSVDELRTFVNAHRGAD